MGRNLLLKGNSKLPAKETIPHSVKLLPTNVVVSLKDVPSSMLPTLTLVALHQNNSTHRTLTRISSSFSKDNNNNNNNLPSTATAVCSSTTATTVCSSTTATICSSTATTVCTS